MAQSLLISIPEACQRASIGRSSLFKYLADGSISAVKAGRRTLIIVSSLEAWIDKLPKAQFKAPARGDCA